MGKIDAAGKRGPPNHAIDTALMPQRTGAPVPPAGAPHFLSRTVDLPLPRIRPGQTGDRAHYQECSN